MSYCFIQRHLQNRFIFLDKYLPTRKNVPLNHSRQRSCLIRWLNEGHLSLKKRKFSRGIRCQVSFFPECAMINLPPNSALQAPSKARHFAASTFCGDTPSNKIVISRIFASTWDPIKVDVSSLFRPAILSDSWKKSCWRRGQCCPVTLNTSWASSPPITLHEGANWRCAVFAITREILSISSESARWESEFTSLRSWKTNRTNSSSCPCNAISSDDLN